MQGEILVCAVPRTAWLPAPGVCIELRVFGILLARGRSVYYNTRGVQGADCSLNNKDLRVYFLHLPRAVVDPHCSLIGSLFSEELVVISDNFIIDKRFGLVDRADTYGNTADTRGNPRECPFPPSTRVLLSAGLSRAVLCDAMLCSVHVVGTREVAGSLSPGQSGVSSLTESFRDFPQYMEENVGLCYCRPRLSSSAPMKFIILSRAVYHLTFLTYVVESVTILWRQNQSFDFFLSKLREWR